MFLGVFIFGCIIFFITKYIKSLKLNDIIYDIITFVGIVIGIAVFAYIVIIINAETLWWPAVGSSLIMIGTSNDSGLSKLIFGNPITYFLGQISYALYLSALTTEFFVAYYWIYPTPLWLKFATSVTIATILHYIIKLPARQFIRQLKVNR
ncbi:MAG: hypothetical protein AB8U82_01030 [Rickettsia endosymbiont of Haemaphysalis japonica]